MPGKPSVRYKRDDLTPKAEKEWDPKWWPAPEGALAGLQIEVFWDVDSCGLQAVPLRDNDSYERHLVKLDILQHSDVLFDSLGENRGEHYRLHIFMSRDKLRSLPLDWQASLMISQSKSRLLSVHVGDSEKEAAEALRMGMECYGKQAEMDDVLVLISGNSYFVSTAKQLVTERHIQLLQLSAGNNLGPEWQQVEVAWHCNWESYMKTHGMRAPIRSSCEQARENILKKVQAIEDQQAAFSEVGIIILIDATKSMQPCIDQIKDRIKDDMLLNLVTRLPHLRNKIFFSVVAYRDVKEEDSDPPEIEIMGHNDALYPQQKPQQRHFTNNVEDVKLFLEGKENTWRPAEKGLIAAGGGDWPEDIASGLTEVADLNFGDQETIARRACILFHVFNDPGYGKDFNSTYTGNSTKSGKPKGHLYDVPPPGCKDPAEEIREALVKLKKRNVIKYVMLTMNPSEKRDRYPSPPTATFAKIKEIARSIPVCGSTIDLENSTDGMREDWVEEIFLNTATQENAMDCVPLVKSMIKAIIRSMTNASAMSTVSRNTKWRESEVQHSNSLFSSQESPSQLHDVACYVNLADIYDWMKWPRHPTGLRAAGSKTSGLYGLNPAYQSWYCNEGRPALERLATKLMDETDLQELNVLSMIKPYSLRDLINLVDSQDGGLTPKKEPKIKPMFRVKRDEVFAEGAERSCVLGVEHTSNLPLLVFKHFKHSGEGAKSIHHYKKLLSAHCISSFLAEEYNKALDAKNVAGPRLQYVDACITTIFSGDRSKGNTFFEFRERFVAGQFRKFTNNMGYSAPPEVAIDACSAFAHWAYVVTEGRAMVTDVQGWYDKTSNLVLLTDPCLVCTRMGLIDDMFKDTGVVGMESYFKSHSCDNSVCQALGLHNIKPVPDALAEVRAQIERMVQPASEATSSSSTGGNSIAAAGLSSVELQAHKAAMHHASMARLRKHFPPMDTILEIPPKPDKKQPKPVPRPDLSQECDTGKPESGPKPEPNSVKQLPLVVKLVYPSERHNSVCEGGFEISKSTGVEVIVADLAGEWKEGAVMVKAMDRQDAVSCPTEAALLRLISLVVEQEGSGPRSFPEEVAVKLLINRGFVPDIKGNKSANFKAMKETLGVVAEVVAPTYKVPSMSDNEQAIRICGPYVSIKRAIHSLMEEFRAAVSKGQLPVISQPPNANLPALAPEETVFRILVPTNKIASLLGQGNKKRIESACSTPASEARFYVRPKAGNENEQVTTCRSKDSTQYCGAANLIMEVAKHIMMKSGAQVFEPMQNTQIRLAVPDKQKGVVLGRGGVIIKGLQDEFDCKLAFYDMPYKKGDSGPRLSALVIKGLPDDILAALRRITTLLRGSGI